MTATKIGKTEELSTIPITAAIISNPTRIVSDSSGTFAIGSPTDKKVAVYDVNPETGSWVPRPILPAGVITPTGISEFGFSFDFVGNDTSLIIVGDPGDNLVYAFKYSFLTSSWSQVGTAADVGSASVSRFGEHVVAVSAELVMVQCEYDWAEIFHLYVNTSQNVIDFVQFDDSIQQATTSSSTFQMYGRSFDVTQNGIVVVGGSKTYGDDTTPGPFGLIQIYTVRSNAWTEVGTTLDTIAATAVEAGAKVKTSSSGNTVAALTGVFGTSPNSIVLAAVDLSIQSFGVKLKPTTTQISVGVKINDFAVFPGGNSIAIATPTNLLIYEYRNLAQTWSLSKTVVGNCLSVSANRSSDFLFTAVFQDGVDLNVKFFRRRETSQLDRILQDAPLRLSSSKLTIDSLKYSDQPIEYILERGAVDISSGYGLSTVEQKIAETLKDMEISTPAGPDEKQIFKFEDLADVDVATADDINLKDGRVVTYSNTEKAWTDSIGWWEDLRFPLIGSTAIRGNNLDLRQGNTFPDFLNGGVIFGVDATFTANAFIDGNVVSALAQMPHSWVEGTEIRPHVHWRQSTTYNINWLMLVRLIKNNDVDVGRPLNSEPPTAISASGECSFGGVASSIIAYVGVPEFTYPGTGDFTQISTFRRKLVDTANQNNNIFTATGVDMTGYIGSTMVCMTLIRDRTNASGMFSNAETGANWETGIGSPVDVLAYEIDIHYIKTSLGSKEEVPERRQGFMTKYSVITGQ